MSATVELIPASMWVCDACGRDNFVRHRRVEWDSDEAAKIIAQLADGEDIDDMATAGEWLIAPTEVVCGHCKAEFTVEGCEVD